MHRLLVILLTQTVINVFVPAYKRLKTNTVEKGKNACSFVFSLFSLFCYQRLDHPNGKVLCHYCLYLGFYTQFSHFSLINVMSQRNLLYWFFSFSFCVIRKQLTLVPSCYATTAYVLGSIPNFLISLSLVSCH